MLLLIKCGERNCTIDGLYGGWSKMDTWECLITAKQAAKLAKVRYPNVHYWYRSGLLPEPVVPARGTGTRRKLSLLDVVRLRCVATLRAQGASLQLIRRVVNELTQHWNVEDPLLSGRLLIVGEQLFWDVDDATLLDVTSGQLAARGLILVPIQAIIQDSRAKIRALCAA